MGGTLTANSWTRAASKRENSGWENPKNGDRGNPYAGRWDPKVLHTNKEADADCTEEYNLNNSGTWQTN